MTDGLDIRDGSGRLRRIVISLMVGVAVSAIAYMVANALVKPELEPATTHVASRQISGSGFVIWVTMIAGAVALTSALAIQNLIARKKWRAQNEIAPARVV